MQSIKFLLMIDKYPIFNVKGNDCFEFREKNKNNPKKGTIALKKYKHEHRL